MTRYFLESKLVLNVQLLLAIHTFDFLRKNIMKNNRFLIPTALVAITTGLVLSGCSMISTLVFHSREDTITTSQSLPSDTSHPTQSPRTSSTRTSEPAKPRQVEIPVNAVIEDPDTYDRIEIISAIRNYDIDPDKLLGNEDAEVVLVQVKITPGQVYDGTINPNDFVLYYDDDSSFASVRTRYITDELSEAGYPPLVDFVERQAGGEHTGWLAFVPNDRAETYRLEYFRPGAQIIDTDESIEPFTKIVELHNSST